MWLTRVAIGNPYLAAVAMLAIVVLGLFSWQRLSVEEFPDIRFPVAVVTVGYPGAAPAWWKAKSPGRWKKRSTPSMA